MLDSRCYSLREPSRVIRWCLNGVGQRWVAIGTTVPTSGSKAGCARHSSSTLRLHQLESTRSSSRRRPSIPSRTAVIIGASSGIGEALARQLNREGWRLGLLARRLDRLEALRQAPTPETVVRGIDVSHDTAAAILGKFLDELGGVDLVIISAGTGHLNRDLNAEPDIETVRVNVLGF